MKKLLFILIVALVSCDKKEDPGPKYESLAGEWAYDFSDSNGSFSFVFEKSGETYNIKSSSVAINGTVYTNNTNTFQAFADGPRIGSLSISNSSNFVITIQGIQPLDGNAKMGTEYIRRDANGIKEVQGATLTRKP